LSIVAIKKWLSIVAHMAKFSVTKMADKITKWVSKMSEFTVANHKMNEQCSNRKMTEQCINEEWLNTVPIEKWLSSVENMAEFSVEKMV
jgi:hypothetical protein